MNKRILYTTIVIVAVFAGLFISRNNESTGNQDVVPTVSEQNVVVDAESVSTIVIDFGDGYVLSEEVSYSGQITAYELLTQVLDSNELTYEVTEYDFGVFVEAIDDKVGSADMSWIYFINGESGMVAADEAVIESGDLVEWKYIEPSY